MPTPLAALRGAEPLPRDVWVLSIVAFFVSVGFGVIVPVLPVLARSFGVGDLAVGAVVSGFALMRLVTSPTVPRIGRLIGERTTLGVGMLIVGASSVAAGLAHSYWQLLVMRGLGGVGSAMFTVSAMTLLVRSVGPERRGRASAVYQAGFLIGGMAGPAVGAVFASISVRAPFFFYAATLIAAGMTGLLLLSPPAPRETDPATRPETMPLAVAWRDVRYRAACLTGLGMGWQSMGVRTSLVPVLVVEALHRSPTWTAGAFAMAAVVQTLAVGPAGRFVDVTGRRPALIAAGVITGVAALATPFSPNVWVLAAILAVYGIGSSLHSTAPTAVVGDVVGPHGGTPIAAYSMTTDIGSIAGPLVAGWIADHFGLHWAFAAGAALLLAGALYAARMPRRAPAQPAGSTAGSPA